jgi:uncharacterized protein (DUF2141 family)
MRIFLAALLALWPLAASAATLTVKVENVNQKGGLLFVGLYDAASFAGGNAKPVHGTITPAVAGEMVVRLYETAPGAYAVKVMQDLNANGRVDSNFVGIPTEPYGFSNDAKGILGPPSFDAAKIDLKPGDNVIVIHLR